MLKNEPYSKAVDLWSLGVILYILSDFHQSANRYILLTVVTVL